MTHDCFGDNLPYEGTRNLDADFQNGETLADHAGWHGNGDSGKYLKKARNFLDGPVNSNTRSFVLEGEYYRYNLKTHEFGIIGKHGGIRTYYIPDRKVAYWLSLLPYSYQI